jgi:nitrite reductase/ring-hydroxylating ferredoxin subunit
MVWATHRVRACSLQELPPGAAHRLRIAFPPVVVFNVDGTVHAVEDIRTGDPGCPPEAETPRTYEVEVIAGEVIVHIETARRSGGFS